MESIHPTMQSKTQSLVIKNKDLISFINIGTLVQQASDDVSVAFSDSWHQGSPSTLHSHHQLVAYHAKIEHELYQQYQCWHHRAATSSPRLCDRTKRLRTKESIHSTDQLPNKKKTTHWNVNLINVINLWTSVQQQLHHFTGAVVWRWVQGSSTILRRTNQYNGKTWRTTNLVSRINGSTSV